MVPAGSDIEFAKRKTANTRASTLQVEAKTRRLNPTVEGLLMIRAVEVLEGPGMPEAKRLLEALAKGVRCPVD